MPNLIVRHRPAILFLRRLAAAPTAAGALADQTFAGGTGTQTFATAGDFTGSGLTFSLVSPPTGVTINSTTGVVSVNTNAMGRTTAAIVVRATNANGSADSAFDLTVTVATLSLDFVNDGNYIRGALNVGTWAALVADAGTAFSFARASTAFHTNAAGVMASFASGAIRINDTGLLYEPAKTNLKRYSQDLNTGWSNNGVAPTANAGVAPDGTTTAEQLVTTLEYQGVIDYTAMTFAIGQYTLAVRYKVTAGAGQIRFGLTNGAFGGTGSDRTIHMTVATGALITNAFAEATNWGSIPLGSSWYIAYITFNTTAAATSSMLVYPGVNAAQTILLWGASTEAGLLTSYIPTTTSSASRVADALTLDLPGGLQSLFITFDNNTTQEIPGLSGGAYLLPTNLNRSVIKTINNTRPEPAAVTARSSDLIVDGFGVNTHFNWGGTNYVALRESHLIPAMADLGVRHYRDTVDLIDDATLRARMGTLYSSYGMRAQLICGDDTAANNKTQLDLLSPTIISGIEGRNEPGGGGNDSAAATEAASHIAALYTALRADTDYNGIPIISPSYISSANVGHAGNLSASIDYINIHPYPGGSHPEAAGLVPTVAYTQPLGPAKNFFVTETGYHLNEADTAFLGVSEIAAAIYLPRVVCDTLTHSTITAVRCIIHEMLCHDAGWAGGPGATETNFGLLNQDGSKRLQFYSMKALLGAMANPGGATPSTLPIILSGANANVKMKPFIRSDGSFNVLLWNAVTVYTPATDTNLSVADVSEVITLGGSWASASRLRVTDGTSPPWNGVTIASNTITLGIGPEVSVLRLVPV